MNNISDNILKRIKEQEPKWFSTLLIIHGAIAAFTVQADLAAYFGDGNNSFKLNMFLMLYVIVILMTAVIWGLVAMNYRLQFYRARVEMEEIKTKLQIDELIKKWKSLGFKQWRKTVTVPKETVFHYFILLGALNFVSLLIPMARLYFTFNWWSIWFIIIGAILGISAPIFYWQTDKVKLRKLYSTRIENAP